MERDTKKLVREDFGMTLQLLQHGRANSQAHLVICTDRLSTVISLWSACHCMQPTIAAHLHCTDIFVVAAFMHILMSVSENIKHFVQLKKEPAHNIINMYM